MLANERINLAVANEVHSVEQSNGVRQGAPDSPVAFAAMVGQVLNEVLGLPPSTANPSPPTPMHITGPHSRAQWDPPETERRTEGHPCRQMGEGFKTTFTSRVMTEHFCRQSLR